MTLLREIYRCNICGNVIEVVHEGASALVCCGEPMEKLIAKNKEEGMEKHVPVVAGSDGRIQVQVGSIEHPMVEKHYIKFIEVLTKDKVVRAELEPGQEPSAVFNVLIEDIREVREFCNIHGLWKK